MTKWLPLLVAVGTASWAAQARAGARIESEIMVNAKRPVDTILELQGDSFRINLLNHTTGDVLKSTIFDGERILQLDARNKTYTAMTMAELKTQMAGLDQMQASMPPEARPEPVFTFARAPGGDTIAGISCDNYAMTRDGKNGGLVCLAAWKHVGLVTKADMAPMRKLADQIKSFGSHAIGDLAMGPDFEKWPGWPLAMAGEDGRQRTRVTKISRATFPANNFAPPAGYTLKPSPMLGNSPHAQPQGQ